MAKLPSLRVVRRAIRLPGEVADPGVEAAGTLIVDRVLVSSTRYFSTSRRIARCRSD
jgi:hypothetical protein